MIHGLLSRRHFLRRLGVAVGATLGTSPLAELAAVAAPAPVHVVIAGAGLAGLCAALELERRGHTCTILEAETRHVGGRARTLRFEGGLYGEAGAMRVPKSHTLTRHYVAELGLTLRPFVQSNPDAFMFMRGRRERVRDVTRLGAAYGLAAAEQGKSPEDLWAASFVKRLQGQLNEERQDFLAVEPRTEAVRALDRLSVRRVLEAERVSAEAIEFLSVGLGVDTLLDDAATEAMREESQAVWSQSFDEIVGGTDRLPAAMAAQLRDKPFPVLARVEVEPGFSGAKRRAIRELHYDSSTKILATTARRFWEQDDGIYGGGTFTDLPTGTTWYPSDNATARDPKVSAAPGVFLASYSWGQTARRWASMPQRERSQSALRHLARVHPQLVSPGVVTRTASWSWDTYRWSGGAFAWFTPGQHVTLHRHVVAPEGRIYFAGEHASLTHTWMQGALESGLVAVRDMLAAASS